MQIRYTDFSIHVAPIGPAAAFVAAACPSTALPGRRALPAAAADPTRDPAPVTPPEDTLASEAAGEGGRIEADTAACAPLAAGPLAAAEPMRLPSRAAPAAGRVLPPDAPRCCCKPAETPAMGWAALRPEDEEDEPGRLTAAGSTIPPPSCCCGCCGCCGCCKQRCAVSPCRRVHSSTSRCSWSRVRRT